MICFLRLSKSARLLDRPCRILSLNVSQTPKAPGYKPFSTDIRPDYSEAIKDTSDPNVEQFSAEKESELRDDDISVPWYLRDDIKSPLLDEKEVKIPETPAHAPAHLSEFLNLLATDYGMENLLLFDMTTLDDSHEFKANNRNVDFIVIATGKSERHILKASTEFRTYIKHKYDILPSTEGIVSNGKTPAMRRKLLRRARKGPSSTDNEYGRAANSWVLFHHDNVDVHIMTAERRLDLNLELLWCPTEDVHLYEQKPTEPVESDHIFSGIRRFHTLAGARRSSSFSQDSSQRHLQALLLLSVDLPAYKLASLKATFDADFAGSSLADFTTKYTFYKALHLVNPDVVTFEDAECALLEKYAFFPFDDIISEDLSRQKVTDVAEYAKLLLDSPNTHVQSRESSDTALDKLTQFISVLYMFSPEKFSMSQDPEFIPLLWRMSFWTHGNVVFPRDIDDFIALRGAATMSQSDGSPQITLASNDARNVLTLIDHHAYKTNKSVSPAFNELLLYSYGNAGEWDNFWDQWDRMFFPDTPLPDVALLQWVRLVVFFLHINHHAQSLRFIDYYWKNGSSVCGTFSTAFEASGRIFASENEKLAFVKAMRILVDSLDPKEEVFGSIRTQLAQMETATEN